MEQLESRSDKPESHLTFVERIRELRVNLEQIREVREKAISELEQAEEMYTILDEKAKKRTAEGTLTGQLLQLLEVSQKNIDDFGRAILSANELENEILQMSVALSERVEEAKAKLLNIGPERMN